jgi:hypothetical protein
MHSTGKIPLNLPFYLYRSLGKMAEKVQARVDKLQSSLFHLSLVNILVAEDLTKLNRDWDSFLASTNIPLDPKGDTSLSAERMTSNSSSHERRDVAEQGKRRGKEAEGSSPRQPVLNKCRRLFFTYEPKETQAPSKPVTRSSARRIPIPTVQTEFVEVAAQEMEEEHSKSQEKYLDFIGMQQQLKEVQHVIAQFYQENRELKRKLAKKDYKEQTTQNKVEPKNERSKGKEVMKILETTVVSKPTTPLTRYSAKKNSPEIQTKLEASERPPTLPTEGEKNKRWTNKKLREAQNKIVHLREENRILDDRAMKHFKECKPVRENACATLSNA